MAGKLVAATATIPEERVGDLLEYAAKLVREGLARGSVPSAPAVGQTAPSDRAGWVPEDVNLAIEVIRSSASEHVRAAWRALAASGPQNRLSGSEMDQAVGIQGRRRNGVLSRMVASCRVRGRVGPWRWDPATNTYWMEPTEARLFTEALAEV